MKLKVTVKNVYGNELIYPACEKASLFCEIAGKKTFTSYEISKIKALGYEFEVVTGRSSL